MIHAYLLAKESFAEFFAVLKSIGTVNAPVRVSDQSFSFKPVEAPDQIAFEALRTILPAKKFFYPPSETLVEFDKHGVREKQPEPGFQIIFGVHPCELASFGIMDSIFEAAPADTHYLKRRKESLIIGLGCMPDKHCFCQSMGTDSPEKGYDLFMTDIDRDYFIEVNSQEGAAVISKVKHLLKPVTDDDRKRYHAFWKRRSESFTNGFAPDNLRSVMNLEADNEIWDELGKRCLSCGNCTPVCPTCYCFDIVDIASLNGTDGERRREWDSCQFTGFAKVSGDFNFRPTPVDRLKFWYRHKLHGFDDPYGFKTCVGCGRCTVSCPAGIDDIVSVVRTLQHSSQERENDQSK